MHLTKKEIDLIEAIRNYRASRGRMYLQDDIEYYIKKTLTELMEGE